MAEAGTIIWIVSMFAKWASTLRYLQLSDGYENSLFRFWMRSITAGRRLPFPIFTDEDNARLIVRWARIANTAWTLMILGLLGLILGSR